MSLFNNLCCGSLSRIHLRVTDQTQQTGPNEFALHFEVLFGSLLTTNWKVNASLSLNSFLIVFPIAQQFVISSYTEDIETNLRIEKAYLACFLYDIFKKIVGKTLFGCFRFWFLSGFVAFRVTFNELCCGLLSYIHLWVVDQSWQTGPN